MAIDGKPTQNSRLIMTVAFVSCMAGPAIGLLTWFGLTAIVHGLLHPVEPNHPLTFDLGWLAVMSTAPQAASVPLSRVDSVHPLYVFRLD